MRTHLKLSGAGISNRSRPLLLVKRFTDFFWSLLRLLACGWGELVSQAAVTV